MSEQNPQDCDCDCDNDNHSAITETTSYYERDRLEQEQEQLANDRQALICSLMDYNKNIKKYLKMIQIIKK